MLTEEKAKKIIYLKTLEDRLFRLEENILLCQEGIISRKQTAILLRRQIAENKKEIEG